MERGVDGVVIQESSLTLLWAEMFITLFIHSKGVVIWVVIWRVYCPTVTTTFLHLLHYCNKWYYGFRHLWYFQYFFKIWRGGNLAMVEQGKLCTWAWNMFRNFDWKKLTCRNSTYPYTFEKWSFYKGFQCAKSCVGSTFFNFHYFKILSWWKNHESTEVL